MTDNASPPPSDALTKPAHRMNFAAHWSKRQRWIAVLAAVLLVVAGVGVVLYRHVYPSGGELVLSSATDPGANAFMPPAAAPPPTNTQAPPTLAAQRDATAVQTQPLPGNRDGFYGGSVYTADVDRDKVIDFFGAHPPRPVPLSSPSTPTTPCTGAADTHSSLPTSHLPKGTHPRSAAARHPDHQPRIRRSPPHYRAVSLPSRHRRARRRPRSTPRARPQRQPPHRSDPVARHAQSPWHSLVRLPPRRPRRSRRDRRNRHVRPRRHHHRATLQPARRNHRRQRHPTHPTDRTTPTRTDRATTGQEDQPDIDGNYLEHDITNSCGAGPEEIPYTVTHQGNTVTWGEGGQHMDRHPERRRIVHGHQ